MAHTDQFIDHFHDAMEAEAEKFFGDMMAAVKKTAIGKPPPHIKKHAEGVRLWERYKRWDVVEKAARESACGTMSDIFSCGFNLWFHKGRVYAIPIGPNWAIRVFEPDRIVEDAPKWIEDYAFWNNSDEPDDVTRAEWLARQKTWDRINTGSGKASHNARRLWHEVIDATNGIGMFDFAYPRFQRPLQEWVEKNR